MSRSEILLINKEWLAIKKELRILTETPIALNALSEIFFNLRGAEWVKTNRNGWNDGTSEVLKLNDNPSTPNSTNLTSLNPQLWETFLPEASREEGLCS